MATVCLKVNEKICNGDYRQRPSHNTAWALSSQTTVVYSSSYIFLYVVSEFYLDSSPLVLICLFFIESGLEMLQRVSQNQSNKHIVQEELLFLCLEFSAPVSPTQFFSKQPEKTEGEVAAVRRLKRSQVTGWVRNRSQHEGGRVIQDPANTDHRL